jgi:hypothetical protein
MYPRDFFDTFWRPAGGTMGLELPAAFALICA